MKIQRIYKNLKKALEKVKEAESFPDDEIHRESFIQRFEYTFELSWKLLQAVLHDQGMDAYGVKTIIREAGQLGLLSNVKLWISYTNARNNTSHMYIEQVAIDVVTIVRENFSTEVNELLNKVENLYKDTIHWQ